MPIGEQAAAWVARYQRERRPGWPRAHGRAASPRLFLNARGGPLSRVGFWKILKALRAHAPALPRIAQPARRCGTRSPRTCSSAAPTCARFR